MQACEQSLESHGRLQRIWEEGLLKEVMGRSPSCWRESLRDCVQKSCESVPWTQPGFLSSSSGLRMIGRGMSYCNYSCPLAQLRAPGAVGGSVRDGLQQSGGLLRNSGLLPEQVWHDLRAFGSVCGCLLTLNLGTRVYSFQERSPGITQNLLAGS